MPIFKVDSYIKIDFRSFSNRILSYSWGESYTFLHFPTLSYTPETRSPSNFPTLSYTFLHFPYLPALPDLLALLTLFNITQFVQTVQHRKNRTSLNSSPLQNRQLCKVLNYFISIPSGAINSICNAKVLFHEGKFQFLLVRLIAAIALSFW